MAVIPPQGIADGKTSSLETDGNVGPPPDTVAFLFEKRGWQQNHEAAPQTTRAQACAIARFLVASGRMKTYFRGWMAVAFLGLFLGHAEAIDKIAITSFKRPGDVAKVNEGNANNGVAAKNDETIHYELRLQNQTTGDLATLNVEYVIFVQRQKLGQKMTDPAHVDRIVGSQNVDVLNNREPKSVTTTDFTLHKATLGGGWTYTNGGRLRAEDSVLGVWVRVSQNGQMIAEYINPSSVKSRGWDQK